MRTAAARKNSKRGVRAKLLDRLEQVRRGEAVQRLNPNLKKATRPRDCRKREGKDSCHQIMKSATADLGLSASMIGRCRAVASVACSGERFAASALKRSI